MATRYYIEIKKPDGEKLAGELIEDIELNETDLSLRVGEFAQENGICPHAAIRECLVKKETV